MLLYDNPASGNCYKVRLVLAQLALDYERRELDVVDRSNRKAVLGDLNPGLRVPTLVLDDGRPLGESGAILWYLADGTELVPTDPYDRAQVLQWMFFEQYSHEPYVAVPRFWLTKGIEVDPDTLAERQRVGYLAFDALDGHLAGREYLVGGRYSIADVALYAYTHVAHEGGFDLAPYPAIRTWLDRVASQPGHVTIDA
jgi:glutathione S-transferase